MSIIRRFLDTLYPPAQRRMLLLGNDGSGKTSILYRLLLGEAITTIPTIGFNVESYERRRTVMNIWDVGGCDKIRPLWKHYFQGTDMIMYVIDAHDVQRFRYDGDVSRKLLYADGGLISILEEDAILDTPVLIVINKTDIPGVPSVDEVLEGVQVHKILQDDEARTGKKRVYHIVKTSASTGEGIEKAFDWIVETLENPNSQYPSSSDIGSGGSSKKERTATTTTTAEEDEAARLESLFEEWMNREDTPSETFLQQLEDATLESWDHYTHLRIAWFSLYHLLTIWFLLPTHFLFSHIPLSTSSLPLLSPLSLRLYMRQLGRREGMEKIFSSIKNFIERSPITKRSDTSRGTTFHETMTYFWTHMVHYAMNTTANIDGEFKTFLLMNPQLVNGGLFLHFYSKKRMLLDPEARVSVLLPDKVQLPSIISSLDLKDNDNIPAHVRLAPRAPLSDGEFIRAVIQTSGEKGGENGDGNSSNSSCYENPLFAWGHDMKIRLIYLMLCNDVKAGRRRNVDGIFKILRGIEKEHFHMTLSYFWVQMISLGIKTVRKRVLHNNDNNNNNDNNDNTSSGDLSSSFWNFAGIGNDTSNPKSIEVVSNYIEKVEDMQFSEFYRQPEMQKLRNSLLYEKYYSRSIIDSDQAVDEFVLPNLKQFTDHF